MSDFALGTIFEIEVYKFAVHVRTCRKRSLEVIWHVKTTIAVFFCQPIKICTRANYSELQSSPLLHGFFFYFFRFKAIALRDLHVYIEKKDIFHAKRSRYFGEKTCLA